jgi:peroxiredoxin
VSSPVDGAIQMQRVVRGLLITALAGSSLLGVADAELAGAPAPDFVLKAASGKNYRLSEYRGQVVIVSFWASWCGECRSQLEGLTSLYDRYAGSGVEMLAVSLDRELDQVTDTADAIDLGFPALHDAGGAVGEEYDVDRLPYVVLVDRDGVVRDEFMGYRNGDEDRYLDRVRALLSE